MFISRAGHVVSVDEATGQITELGSTSLQSDKDPDFTAALVSKVRREAYFGSAVESHDPSSEQPEEFDQLVSFMQERLYSPERRVQPFVGMALSEDEKTIYFLHCNLSILIASMP